MAKKKKEGGGGVSAQEFLTLTSFCDIMCLCLTFFVLLFMLSEPKKPKLEATMKAFMAQLGVMPANRNPIPTFIPASRADPNMSRPTSGIPGNQPEVRDRIEDERQKFVIAGDELFRPGGTELSAPGQRILQNNIAPELKGFRNRIEVRGHADAVSPEERDAWSLGFARALAVMRFLVDYCGLDESRFRLISCGDKEPVNPADPAANRRVEILMTEMEARGSGGVR